MIKKINLNIKAIIGSILVAFVLWFYVITNETVYTHRIKIPLIIKSIAANKTLLSQPPKEVLVEFRGKGVAFISLWFFDARFELDLQTVSDSQIIKLKDHLNAIELPPTGNLEAIDVIAPTEIDVRLDDYLEEFKPVRFSGNVIPASGYDLIEFGMSLDSVLIKGPKSIVSKINSIQTDTLHINDVKNSFSETVNLSSPSPQLLTLEPSSVELSFNIQRLSEKVIYDIPIRVKNVPAYLQVDADPNVLSLRIKGGEKIVAQIRPENINAEIDFAKNYRKDRTQYSAAISVPENISWIESIPKTFELHIKKK